MSPSTVIKFPHFKDMSTSRINEQRATDLTFDVSLRSERRGWNRSLRQRTLGQQ